MKKIDNVSFVRARRAEAKADIAGGDITSIQTQISTLQGQFSTLNDNVNAPGDVVDLLRGRIATLEALVETLLTHVHSYTDVDNLGATLNKSTGIPS